MSKYWKQCPSDGHNPTKKKSKSSLSSTILDYYNKYGQNRDLEKYFRFRRQGRSSSDESSSNNNFKFSSKPVYGEGGVSTKSLENLSILRSQLDVDKQPSKSRSNESLAANGAAAATTIPSFEPSSVKTPTSGRKTQDQLPIESLNDPQENKSKSNEDIKINVKNAHKSKRKSWNFNMESNVEIIFPPSIAMQQAVPLSQSLPQILPLSQPQLSMAPELPQINPTEYLRLPSKSQETSQTQTDAIEFPKTPIQPIETKVQLTPMAEQQGQQQQRPISATSSITSLSNKQRLEWDSMADIGYDKSAESGENAKKSKSSELTSFEREVLKKFFAQRGLSFDENIVIFGKTQLENKQINVKLDEKSSVSSREIKVTKSTNKVIQEKPPKTNHWENAFQKILEEKLDKQHRSEPSLNGKQLWESALKKFRQKYGIRMNNSDLCITHPDIHSTPYSKSSTRATKVEIDDGGGITNRSMSMSPSLEIYSTKDAPDELKLTTKSTGAIPKISKFMQEKQIIEEQQKKILERLERLEKSCQTSMVVLTSKESQSEVYQSRENYNDPKSDNSSSSNDNIENLIPGTVVDNESDHEDQIESSKFQKELESATSFEFLSASAYEKEKKRKKQTLSFENKENISPTSALIDENKENITLPNEINGGENKENITPPDEIKDENKENVPPLLLLDDVNSITENQNPIINLNSNADQIVQSILESSTSSRTHFDSLSSKDSFFLNDNSNLSLEPNIQKGVELLNKLVETTNMNKLTKKKLIKKIVYRLMKIKYENDKTETTSDIISTKISSPSLTTTTTSSSELVVSRKENITVSGVTTLNSTSSSYEPITTQKSVLNDKNPKPSSSNVQSSPKQHSVADYSGNTVKDWLQPMTHAELDYDQQKSRKLYQQKQKATQQQIEEIEIKQRELQDKLIENQKKILDAKRSTPEIPTDKIRNDKVPPTSAGGVVDDEFDENILRFVSKERNSQLDWIQKEINHLMNLKEFLMGEKKKREMEIMSELINMTDTNKKEPNYENIKTKNVSKKPSNSLSSPKPNQQISEQPSQCRKKQLSEPQPAAAAAPQPPQPPLESSSSINQSSSISDTGLQGNITPSTTTSTTTTTSNEWNSHKNMKKLVRQNRTKLETPNPNDLEIYARAKHQDFIEKYQTMQSKAGKLYANNDDECLIYTQPYSSDHYSEPIENQRGKFICGKSSSAVEPLQRPQYHHHHHHHPHLHFNHERQRHQPPLPIVKRHQQRYQHLQQQQQQPLPQNQTVNDGYTSIATHSSDRSNGGFVSSNSMSISNGINSQSHSSTTTHQYDNANNSIGIQTGSSLLKTSPIHLTSINHRHTILTKKSQQNKEQQTLPQSIAYTITFDCGTQMTDVIKQQFINTNINNDIERNDGEQNQPLAVVKSAKENFLSRAEERRRCIQELNELRRKRNEQRQRLFLLSKDNHSLRTNMNQLNPPPMEMCRRLFTTKNLKMISREKYQQLPEIKRKDEIERQNRLKRSNRFVMDLFNRNLQRRVLRGNVNLSNSLTVSEF